jgi:hypothetical protein
MSHYAKVENGIVTQVIVADQEFIDSGVVGHGWVQTSYNTHKNQHPEGRPLRGNYAGSGFTYDAVNDVFYAPSPFPSWVLNTSTWTWEAPVPCPQDGKTYLWKEENQYWDVYVVEGIAPTPVETLP